jgi:hypothetical protein
MARCDRQTAADESKWLTVGATNVLSLEVARERARGVLSDFFRNVDPKVGLRGDYTLRSALTAYLEARADLRPGSAVNYRDSVERHLSAWADLPLRAITREMVEERLSYC